MKYPMSKFLIIAIILTIYFILPIFSTLIVQNTYDTLVNYFSQDPSEIIVYDTNAKTPATSRLPLSLYSRLININGVEAVSPETIAFTLVNGELVIARGIDINQFSKFENLEILEGNILTINDTYSVIIGYKLANKLNLQVNQDILIQGLGSSEIIDVKVKGIFKTGKIYDDEILMPIFIANILVGMPTSYVSYFRLKTNESLDTNMIYEKFLNSSPTKIDDNTLIRYLIGANVNYNQIIITKSYKSIEEFLIKQLSISQYTIIGFIMVIIALTSALLFNIVEYFSKEIEIGKKIMRMIGANKEKILKYSIVGWSIIFSLSLLFSSLLTYLGIIFLNNYFNIYLVGHQIIFKIPFINMFALILIIFILSIIFLYYNERKF